MDAEDQIIAGLRLLTKYNQRTRIVPALVDQVSMVDSTCTVRDQEDNVIFDVRLRAELDGASDGLVVYPAVNSWVLIANIGGSETEWVVVACSEVEKVVVEVDTTVVEVSDAGVRIQRGGDDLKSLLADLLEAVKALTVTCAAPGSPSSVPLNLASFVVLETRLNALLN